jgi:putative ABC transport system permease protein
MKHPSDREVGDYYSRRVEAVRTIPGVASVGMVNRIPLAGGQTNQVRFENATGTSETSTTIDSRTVTPQYFSTLGIKLIDGRGFTEYDDLSSEAVAVVDDRIAKTIWPGQSPIGKRFHGPLSDTGWVTIVGIVSHIRTVGLETDPSPQIYWNYRQWPQDRMVMVVKGATDVVPSASAVTKAIQSVEAEQSVYDVRTLEQIVSRSMSQRRLTTVLMAGFSGLALLLAAIGIYGVVAYGVTQRLREFSIRVALGATTRELKRLVVWQGASMALMGLGVGIVLVIAASSAMNKLVFGVGSTDIQSVISVTVLLGLVAVLASYIPARRAAAVDPAVALRGD